MLCVKIYKKHYVFHNARTLCVVRDAAHNKKHYEKHNVSPGCVNGVFTITIHKRKCGGRTENLNRLHWSSHFATDRLLVRIGAY